MKPNIPKKLSLIRLIKYAEDEISEWQKVIKDLNKQLEKMEEKN